MTPQQALHLLREGNQRYLASKDNPQALINSNRFHAPIMQQKPFVMMLSCSDSRVPLEQIFDQRSGDIFVVRVAGNIATSSQIGSIEFACEKFASSLIVVLGHSMCGAIETTIESMVDTLDESEKNLSPHLKGLVTEISPAYQAVVKQYGKLEKHQLVKEVTKANVMNSMQVLYDNSSIIQKLVDDSQLEIVGGEFSIETAQVSFY